MNIRSIFVEGALDGEPEDTPEQDAVEKRTRAPAPEEALEQDFSTRDMRDRPDKPHYFLQVLRKPNRPAQRDRERFSCAARRKPCTHPRTRRRRSVCARQPLRAAHDLLHARAGHPEPRIRNAPLLPAGHQRALQKPRHRQQLHEIADAVYAGARMAEPGFDEDVSLPRAPSR